MCDWIEAASGLGDGWTGPSSAAREARRLPAAGRPRPHDARRPALRHPPLSEAGPPGEGQRGGRGDPVVPEAVRSRARAVPPAREEVTPSPSGLQKRGLQKRVVCMKNPLSATNRHLARKIQQDGKLSFRWQFTRGNETEKDPDTGFSIKKWDDGIWMRSKEMHAGGRESRGQRVSEGRPVGEGRRAAEGAGRLGRAARGPVSSRDSQEPAESRGSLWGFRSASPRGLWVGSLLAHFGVPRAGVSISERDTSGRDTLSRGLYH